MSKDHHPLITDTGDASRLIKYLQDSIPLGEHPNPHTERVSVRLDVLQAAIDHIEWLKKGNEEWCKLAVANARQRGAAAATACIAIKHLQDVLKDGHARIPSEQRSQWRREAEDWLVSIGSKPD